MRGQWLWSLLVGIGLLSGCVPISAPTPTAIPPNETATPVAETAPVPDALETRATSMSPDGEWRAESAVAFPDDRDEYYQRLTVTRTDGQTAWTPVETWSHMGLGYTVAVPFHWSSSGEALYFTNGPVPDGCALFVNGFGLQRLDLLTGEVNEVLPGHGLTLAISPAEDRVAEIVYGPPTLVIHDLATDAARSLPLPAASAAIQAGSLVWSPDGAQIALALAHDPCVGGWAGATSVLVVDAATQVVTTLVDQDDRLLRPVEWSTMDTLILEGEDGERSTLDPTPDS